MPTIERGKRRKWIPKRHRRPTSDQDFYNSTSWRRFRKSYLAMNPVCKAHQAAGIVKPAHVLDHIIPISENGHRRSYRNIMALCKSCHDGIKSNLEGQLAKQGKAKILVDWVEHEGAKVPKDYRAIYKILVPKIKK